MPHVLRPSFTRTTTDLGTHSWDLDQLLEATDEEELARVLAELVMKYRCRNRPDIYQMWSEQRSSKDDGEIAKQELIMILIKAAVGIPSQPRSKNHVQAFVAEHLWYFLTLESPDPTLEHVEGPSFEVTEIGSDGLEIYRLPSGELAFRLWELKKHVAKDSVSRTVGTAYDQLINNSLRYLARYVTVRQHDDMNEIALFYSRMAEHWVLEDEVAAVGISVTISEPTIPISCFTTLHTRFPGLLAPPRCKGLITATEDFDRFSNLVQKELWKGL